MTNQSDCLISCTLTSDDPNVEESVISFQRDPGKKSSYSLDMPTTTESTSPATIHSVAAPAQCYVQCTDEQLFFLGGFRMTSNSRTVEVYLDDGKNNDKSNQAPPAYLTTSRGIPYKPDGTTTTITDENLYKIVCVIPGGARPVRQLYLKPLNLKPAETDRFRLSSFHLTARLKDKEEASPASQPSVPSSLFASTPQLKQMMSSHPALAAAVTPHLASSASSLGGSTVSPGQRDHQSHIRPAPEHGTPSSHATTTTAATTALSAEDIGAAMAGVSFLVRTAQEEICDKIDQSRKTTLQQTTTMQRQMLQGVQQQLQQLTGLIVKQQETLQGQAALLQKQATELESLRQEIRDAHRPANFPSTTEQNEVCNDVVPDDSNSLNGLVQDQVRLQDTQSVENVDSETVATPENHGCQTETADKDDDDHHYAETCHGDLPHVSVERRRDSVTTEQILVAEQEK